MIQLPVDLTTIPSNEENIFVKLEKILHLIDPLPKQYPMSSLFYGAPLIGLVILGAMFIHLRQKRDELFMHAFRRSLIAGVVTAFVLILSGLVSDSLGISEPRNLKRTLFFSFITMAGAAEFTRFIAFRYYVIRRYPGLVPADAVILSIVSALSFSMLFLAFTFTDIPPAGRTLPVVLFSMIYIPANLVFGVVTGFFVGMARYLKIHFVYSFTGLAVAIFFHGMFIFCLITRDFKLMSLFAFGAAMIVTFLAMKASGAPSELSK